MSDNARIREMAAYLDWHAAMGVDVDLPGGTRVSVGNDPCDWFGDAQRAAAAPRPGRAPTASQPATTSITRRPAVPRSRPATPPPTAPDPDASVLEARERAGAAATLEALGETLASFEGCGLKKTAKSLCFYRGAPTARLMIVGEAPGRDEDLSGTPFVGRAGQLLDKMLAAIDLGESDVHITNLVYWRPPGNRNPTPQEALVCRPFLDRQIELVAPEMLMILGRPATNNLLANTESILKQRGRWKIFRLGDATLPAMPTLHPAYLLRTPLAKRMAWRDLLAVRARLDGAGS